MTLIADSSGNLSGKFTVPANVPVGAKPVAALGAGGSYGIATYTARGTVTNEERRLVTTITEQRFSVDPIAQTFQLSESRHVGGVDLWFTVAGVDDVVVQIRDTASGFPGKSVLAEKRIAASSIVIGGNHTRIAFDAPVWLDSGIEYAIVVLTDGATAALSVAELGKFDATAQKWITSQAYQVGVLLSSSNASTWTAHQEKDLTFRLLGCKFSGTTKTVSLGNITLTNASDLLALYNLEVPATGAKAELLITGSGGTTYRLQPGAPINLASRVTGTVAASLALTGTEKASPVVYPGIQLAEGDVTETATYLTRAFPCGTSARVAVTLEAYTPGTSAVAVAVKKQDGTWQTLTLTSGADVGDGWVERSYVVTGFTADATAVKVTTTGTPQYRPLVRKLRAVATD